MQLGLEAQIGDCPAVVALARQLLADDATAVVLAATKRDPAVARCLGYRM